ncbi:rRNA N6-adenosine-methyltransferase ZCCHC4 [Drosophila tropicalis]|uniref:rRNA N6-adenosine-methyltransferase ZCCHC4 n=1 Tax=Drosophila tropicalis TaxID=46794 RepID=UPI0035ABAA16
METKCRKNDLQKEKLLIQLEEDDAEASEQHPCCLHGPTILFYRQSQKPQDGFYACSAHRDAKLCKFQMPAAKWKGESIKRELSHRGHPHINQEKMECSKIVDPTLSMRPLEQDAVNAQYFFDANALTFLAKQCQLLGITKVVCMGAPRLHFHLRDKCKNIQSFLLDLDERFAYHLGPNEFCHYNMCNNHFFYDRRPFESFLQGSITDRVLIVTDPPFGCRTELIAHTLHSLRHLHNRLNQIPWTPLSIFWIYPYFAYNYIKQQMPEMEMSDYLINYTNHSRYTNVGDERRAYGSPVRLFTNVPLDQLNLTTLEGYKYCDKCEKHTAQTTTHCDLCGKCSSQNGQIYRHCTFCDMCVKPNYVHCPNCRRCTQREGHVCSSYQSNQTCWLCGARGHIESNCRVLENLKKNKAVSTQRGQCCLLCGRKDHRERRCKQRSKYFNETEFMGQKTIEFTG